MTRAIRYARYGDPDVLTLDEVTLPEPGPGQVRIAVWAAGVNAIDWKLRRGFRDVPLAEPRGTGIEVAGVVDAVGPGVAGRRPGDAVFGQVPSGAAATHVLAAAKDMFDKPDGLSYEQAAAIPVAAETAARTLRVLGVRAGQTLLIHAAAGGVGLVAAQLAAARKATVIGTASAAHHAFLREIGVTPVTYGTGLVERVRAAAPQGIDAVLDASGRGALPASIELTGDPGKVVTIADPQAAEYGVRFSRGSDAPTGTEAAQAAAEAVTEAVADVLALMESGRLRLPIQESFPLERTADAHRLSESGHLRGKIVISVAP